MDSARTKTGIMKSKIMEGMEGLASSAAEGLKKIGKPVWKVLTFSPADDMVKPASCVCISIENGHIAIAQMSRLLSRYSIRGFKKYHFAERQYPKPEEVASTASLAIKEWNAGKPEVILSIPKQWVVVKSAELPASVAENLPEVVSYELDRLTPFSADGSLYDFIDVKKSGDKISFLVAAAKADTINKYLAALAEEGIAVQSVSFDLSGTSTLYRYISGNDTFAFVEVSDEGIRGGAVNGGAMVKAVSSAFSREDDRQKADMIAEKMEYLASGLNGYSYAPRILLSFQGKTAALKDMVKRKEGFSIGIINEMEKKIEGTSDYRDLSAAAVGSSIDHLWPKAKGFNLLRRGISVKQKTPLALTVVLMLIIVAIVGTYLIIPIKIENQRLKDIEKQIALKKGEVQKVEELKKEIDALNGEIAFINNFKNSQPMALNMLRELTTILPHNAWLTRVRIAESQVNIEGYAPSATVLIPKLEASRYFRKVEFASPTFRDARQDMDRFQIKMEIKEAKEAKDEKK